MNQVRLGTDMNPGRVVTPTSKAGRSVQPDALTVPTYPNGGGCCKRIANARRVTGKNPAA